MYWYCFCYLEKVLRSCNYVIWFSCDKSLILKQLFSLFYIITSRLYKYCLSDKVHSSKVFAIRFSKKGESLQVFPVVDTEICHEVPVVCFDWVVWGCVLLTGVDHAGSVLRIVGEKFTVTRESKFPLQFFSFIHQTLHLSIKYNFLYKYLLNNKTWQSSKGETPAFLNSWQEWYFSSSFWINIAQVYCQCQR